MEKKETDIFMNDPELGKGVTDFHKNDNQSYYLYDNIVELYKDNFIDNYNEIINHISTFIGYRNDVLQSKNPGMKLLYSTQVENTFFDIVGIDKNTLKKIIKNNPTTNKNFIKHNNPLFILLLVMISFYYKNRELFLKMFKKHNITHVREPYMILNVYFTLRIYSSTQMGFFQYPPNPNLMEYTVNNLNDRFQISKVKNIYEIVNKYAESNFRVCTFYFDNPTDFAITQYIDKMTTRLKSFFYNINKEMHKFKEEFKSTQTETMELTNSSDGKKFLNIASNVSNDIDSVSKKIVNSFIQDSIIKKVNLRIACQKTDVDMTKMEHILNVIREGKDKTNLIEIFKNIIAFWLVSKEQTITTINSKSFIEHSFKAYKISNTNDVFILAIKDNLDSLLKLYSEEYLKTNRKATMSNFKQCLYIYLILFMVTSV